MNQKWNELQETERLALVVRCGWITAKGSLSSIGRRILNAEWFDLSEAARNVIERKLA